MAERAHFGVAVARVQAARLDQVAARIQAALGWRSRSRSGRDDDHAVLPVGQRQPLPGLVLQVGEQRVIAGIA